jgi:uncharacterized phosphosugar-binding protein
MKKGVQKYSEVVAGLLANIVENSGAAIDKAADLMCAAVKKDQLIHIVGSGGHSVIGAMELFWRAGSLANINALLDAGIDVANGAKRSNIIERTEGYGKSLLKCYDIKEGEVLIIVNAYGINPLTVELGLEAKRLNLKTIGVTSKSFADTVPQGHPARHSSGKNLYEIVDVFVNCKLPLGDAIIELEGLDQKVGPTSTLVNCFTVNSLVIRTVEKLLEQGIKPPVWVSANLPGGDKANQKWENKYFGRIKHLR